MRRAIPHLILATLTVGAGLATLLSVGHQPWSTTTVAIAEGLCRVDSPRGSQDVTLTPSLAGEATKLGLAWVSTNPTVTGHGAPGDLSFAIVSPRGGSCTTQMAPSQFRNSDGTPGRILAARISGTTSDEPSLQVLVGNDTTGSLLICNLVATAREYLQKEKMKPNYLDYFCPALTNHARGKDGVVYYESYDVNTRTNVVVAGGYIAHSPATAMQVACSWNEPDASPYGCRDLVDSIFKINSHS